MWHDAIWMGITMFAKIVACSGELLVGITMAAKIVARSYDLWVGIAMVAKIVTCRCELCRCRNGRYNFGLVLVELWVNIQ